MKETIYLFRSCFAGIARDTKKIHSQVALGSAVKIVQMSLNNISKLVKERLATTRQYVRRVVCYSTRLGL